MPRALPKTSCWFDLKDDPFGGRVEVVHLTNQEIADIRERVETARSFFDRESRQLRHETRINTNLDRKLTAIRAIKNWENFFDDNGKPMDCTPANKEHWSSDNDFMNQLRGFQIEVAKMAKKQQEEALGNLPTLASGSPA